MSAGQAHEAIVLYRAPLRETGLLVSWLTRDAGRIKTSLRGARKPGSATAACPDLFEKHDILVARSRASEIHSLRESRLLCANEGIREDYHRYAVACYFARLIEAATEPEHPVSELYDLLERALGYLATRPPRIGRLPLLFERRLAERLGVLGPDDSRDGAEALSAAGVVLPRNRESLLASLRAFL